MNIIKTIIRLFELIYADLPKWAKLIIEFIPFLILGLISNYVINIDFIWSVINSLLMYMAYLALVNNIWR